MNSITSNALCDDNYVWGLFYQIKRYNKSYYANKQNKEEIQFNIKNIIMSIKRYNTAIKEKNNQGKIDDYEYDNILSHFNKIKKKVYIIKIV